MALRELPLLPLRFRTIAALSKDVWPATGVMRPCSRRNASTDAVREVEASSSLEVPPPPEELVRGYDPVARSRLRRRGNKELPPSRYEASRRAGVGRPVTATALLTTAQI